MAVLCMLYKIRCNPKHPLCGSLPVPYVPVRVTRSALIAHRYTFAPPLCRISQYRRTIIPFSVSLWNDLVDPVFDGVELAGFKSRSNAFCWPSCSLLFVFNYFPFLFFSSIDWLCGTGVFGLIVKGTRQPSLSLSPSPGLAFFFLIF